MTTLRSRDDCLADCGKVETSSYCLMVGPGPLTCGAGGHPVSLLWETGSDPFLGNQAWASAEVLFGGKHLER